VRIPFIFRVRRPRPADVEAVVAALTSTAFTYPMVGSTREPPPPSWPPGWDGDEVRGRVGRGEVEARRAEDALRAWQMFDLDWVRPHRVDVPQEAGEMMAFTAHTFGVWTINVCRVVYRLEEDDGAVRRTGFAYGTLPGHVLSGEERFELTWDRSTGEVWFAIRKVSRPRLAVVRWGGPLIRRVQRRFSVDAIARIARAARGAA
jgi:uncharacterized protein (UPF0548 family)